MSKNYKCNIYNFIIEISNQQIQKDLKKSITLCSTKYKHQGNEALNKQKSEQERKYMFSQCWDRLQAYGKLGINQYNWLQQDQKGQYFIIMSELCKTVKQKYQNYQMTQQIQEIQKFEKDINKKKKKNKKKKTQKQQQKQQITQSQKNDEPQPNEKDFKLNEAEIQTKIKVQQYSKQQIKETKLAKYKAKVQVESIFIITQTKIKQIQKDKTEKIEGHIQKNKIKALEQRKLEKAICSYLQNFAQSLIQESNRFDRSRKQAKQLLQQTIQALQLKFQWQLILFGSCEIGFALRQSDLDLVLKIKNGQNFSLSDFYNHLKINHWAIGCQLIKIAQIPIISLKINLLTAQKLTVRQLKKLPTYQITSQTMENFIVSVDISLSQSNQEYEGVTNTNNLRILFKQNEYLLKICLLIKELLRKKQLNKPYTGGVSSYVLVMMIYGILKTKQNQIQNDLKLQTKFKKQQIQNLRGNMFTQLKQISHYLQSYLIYDSVINPLHDTVKFVANEQLHLNIVDSFTKSLVKTSAFRLYQIIEQIHKLMNYCEGLRDELKNRELQSKKLKRQMNLRIMEYYDKLLKDQNFEQDNDKQSM